MNRKIILVVDDDPVFQKSISIKLEAAGYAVITALDGSQAVSAARQQKPDLILLDMSFPPDVGTALDDGIRIMGWLKRMEDMAKIPIIVITAGGPADSENKTKAAGAIAVFHKPVDHDKLLGTICTELADEPAAS